MDGGVNRETAAMVGAFGADVLVVGSALFQRGRDTAAEVDMVRRSAWAAAAGQAAPTVNGAERAEPRHVGQPDAGPRIDDEAARRPLP